MNRLLIVVLVGCGSAASTSVTSRDAIPEAVDATAKRLAGGAKVERIEREHEEGETVYEATWHVEGLEREATISADGHVLELEEELPSTQVPAIVRAAAIARLANAQSIKFVQLKDGRIEAEAVIDGREQEAVFTPDGKEVGGDDDDDDDGDGDHDD